MLSPDSMSTRRTNSLPLISNRDLTGPQILQQTQDLMSHGIHYVADTNIISQCKFIFNKDIRGNILVPRGSQAPIFEFVLSGIFQIDPQNFFMTSDGK
jgi:hypothetical protein